MCCRIPSTMLPGCFIGLIFHNDKGHTCHRKKGDKILVAFCTFFVNRDIINSRENIKAFSKFLVKSDKLNKKNLVQKVRYEATIS